MIRRIVAVTSALALGGCNDIVVGTFPLGIGSDTSDGSDASVGSDDSSGGNALPLPGGCVDEPFDSVEADPWNTWANADATIAASGGVLALLPPTIAEQGTGLVLDNTHAFPFTAARVRVEVITPPDPNSETELFLQVTQQVPPTSAILSLGLYRSTVRFTVGSDGGPPMMSGPVADGYPRWIGIRTEGGVVYFEMSEDGAAWTTLATADQPAPFPGATPLVMGWNNASASAIDPQPVVVDNLSICAD